MSLKIPVLDRVSTYPGRIKLTPVTGETNLYDMERADVPAAEGTPINKALFDNKAYTMTKNATVYVNPNGSDSDGDGTSKAPYATVQRAIDSIPKHLGGYVVTVDIASGTYEERVFITGFTSGRLVLGLPERTVVLRGLEVMKSDVVILNISNITWATGFSGTICYAGYGSRVIQNSGLTIRGNGSSEVGLGVTQDSSYTVMVGIVTTVLDCARTAVLSTLNSKISLNSITGSGNTAAGLIAERGALLSYTSTNLSSSSGDAARTGGRILTGGGSSGVASASLE